jgi:hypothetical protein
MNPGDELGRPRQDGPTTSTATQHGTRPRLDGKTYTTGEPFDVVNAPRPLLDAYLAGRRDGFLDGERVGFERGYQACEDEIASLQRAAYGVVRVMAGIDPHEVRQARAVGRS